MVQLMYGKNQTVSEISTLESEVAKLIVHTLSLKVDPARIQPEEPIFGDGMGLDSIDALDPITMVATVPQQHMCGLEASVMFPVYSAGDL